MRFKFLHCLCNSRYDKFSQLDNYYEDGLLNRLNAELKDRVLPFFLFFVPLPISFFLPFKGRGGDGS